MAALRSSACPTIPATASVWMGCTAKMSAASSPSACCRSLGASPGLPPALRSSNQISDPKLRPGLPCAAKFSFSLLLAAATTALSVDARLPYFLPGDCQGDASPLIAGYLVLCRSRWGVIHSKNPDVTGWPGSRRCGGLLCQPLLSLLPEDTSSEVPWPGRRCLRPSEPPLHRLSPFLCSGVSKTQRLVSHSQYCHPRQVEWVEHF